MNQSILLNDDIKPIENGWQQTGLYAGQLITIYIKTSQQQLTTGFKFDIEMAIEDWLDSNEPDQNNQITIELT